ncbi:conserved hypothetical protein, membrane [mine drainage metagenome]|uniref:Uncharacterized protein n=1 Tax=mine drainage metagenome TaxID=410659 RepID=T0Y9G9_9ZZZZ
MNDNTRQMKKIYFHGTIATAIPVLIFIIAFLTSSILILDYVHVLLGALWTGIDIFLGLIFSSVIRTISKQTKVNIARGMIPMTLFFIPAVSIITPASGYVLAVRDGVFDPATPLFTAIIILGIFLVGIGFTTIVPFSWKFARELSTENPDADVISRSMNIVSKGALVQLVFQIAIISLMAYLVVFQ